MLNVTEKVNIMLSVIVPAYNEEEMVEKCASAIRDILLKASILYELIFVDDGSKDNTWEQIVRLSIQRTDIRGIHFSRNFGKEAAIMAGLSNAAGECCVVLDCDLQHPPEKIIDMYKLWEKGYEVVEGRKSSRGDEGKLHSLAARIFYSLISAAVGFDMSNASDFRLLDRKAVNVLLNMRERNAFFRALSSWIGFKSTFIEFDVQERSAGVSKWSTSALVKYAISNISSFSTAPMQIVTALGVVMFLLSIIFGGIALVQKINGIALEGFTTVILLLLFSSSIVMISLGIIGFYIAQIYEEIKGRPRYIISSTCGDQAHDTVD